MPLWEWMVLALLALFGLFYLYMLVESILEHRTLIRVFDVEPDSALSVDLDIVIPARNEEQKLPRCLESIHQQTFANYRVWMVDDRSTDGTGEVMARYVSKDSRFHRLLGMEPPPGWAGKVNAIAQALQHLSARWVLFLDADTWIHPETLARAVTLAERDQIEMLTLYPHLECETFWEKVILPVVVFLIGLRFPVRQVNNPNKLNVAIANGQFVLMNRKVYEALGTHEAIRGSLVEDLDLARLAKKNGVRLRIVSGMDAFRVRMYTNFAEIREGWTKNMYFGNPDKYEFVYLIRCASLLFLGPLPILTLMLGYIFDVPWMIGLSWAMLALMLGVSALNRAWYRLHPFYSMFHPLGLILVSWFMWESRRLAKSSRGVTWKGRQYRAT